MRGQNFFLLGGGGVCKDRPEMSFREERCEWGGTQGLPAGMHRGGDWFGGLHEDVKGPFA